MNMRNKDMAILSRLSSEKNIIGSIFKYLLIPSICTLVVMYISMGAWNIDFSAPMVYFGCDDFVHGTFILRAARGDLNIWTDYNMGYPFGTNMYAFPHIPWLGVVLGYLMGIFTNNYAILVNGYIIITYILNSCTFCYAVTRCGINYYLGILGGVMYTLCQYHFSHNSHFTAIAYFTIPLMVLFLLEIMGVINFTYKKVWIRWILLAILLVMSDFFYAVFSCFLILMTIIFIIVNRMENQLKRAITGISMIAGICLTALLLIAPSLYYCWKNGIKSTSRSAYETFLCGIKIPTLFIPIIDNGHPLSGLNTLYVKNGLPAGEQLASYLGVFAIIGFICLLVFAVKMFRNNHHNSILFGLAFINIWSLILCMSGGICLAFSLFITGKIRTWNRIYVFIYCASLIAFLLCVDKLVKWIYKKVNGKNILFHFLTVVFCAIILIVHVMDMQTYQCIAKGIDFKAISQKYHEDKNTTEKIMNVIGGDATLLCLPYLTYPENLTETYLGNWDYAEFPYLFSESIKLSVGHVGNTNENSIMLDRYGGNINVFDIYNKAIEDGFSAILIDKMAMTDADNVIEQFICILGNENIIANTNRYVVMQIGDLGYDENRHY